MADIESSDSHKKGGAKKARGKKRSTRIDMTPMVDLGFLLITFFILTTTLSQPQAMDIIVPAKEDVLEDQKDRSKVGDEQALTILLAKDNKILFYEGLFDPNKDMKPEYATYGSGESSIRSIMIRKSAERNPRYAQIAVLKKQLNNKQITEEQYKDQVRDIKGYKMGAVVMIKATPEATYENMVNILDEIKIANVGIYAIMEITADEQKIVDAIVK